MVRLWLVLVRFGIAWCPRWAVLTKSNRVRYIVDTSTHSFGANEHVGTKEARFSPCRGGVTPMPHWVGKKWSARYCGHLYSLLWCEWTRWHQRGQVFTLWREGPPMGWQKMVGAILWTPPLTLLACLNLSTPTGLVFHLVEKGDEGNLNGHVTWMRMRASMGLIRFPEVERNANGHLNESAS